MSWPSLCLQVASRWLAAFFVLLAFVLCVPAVTSTLCGVCRALLMVHSPPISSPSQLPTYDHGGNLGYAMAMLALRQTGGRTAVCCPSPGDGSSQKENLVRGWCWVQAASPYESGSQA